MMRCHWLSFAVLAFGVLAGEGQARDYPGRRVPSRRVVLTSEVTGRILTCHVEEGASVKKGELLFQIDDREPRLQLDHVKTQYNQRRLELTTGEASYEQLRAEAKAAEAMLTLQKNRLDRIRKLIDNGAVDKGRLQEVEQAFLESKAQVEHSRLELEKHKANLEQLKLAIRQSQVEVEMAELQLSRCRITAPMNGVVLKVHQGEGNLAVRHQTRLLELVNMDDVVVELVVPLEDLSKMQPGQKVRLIVPGYYLGKGEVIAIVPVVTEAKVQARTPWCKVRARGAYSGEKIIPLGTRITVARDEK